MEIIKRLRKSKGETQQMLADIVGVSLRSIQHYESSKVTIPKKKIAAIANHYGVSVSELFKDTSNNENTAINAEIEKLARECLENWDNLMKHPYFQTKIENLIVTRINKELEERLIKANQVK
ncbi:helix-turn-helix domain-containing protein [Aquimarina longa]|uniref:helix-turn-helix domain-containing protein n=1 Tax=Aquimarina longa TaxID=1080221 RepID=UPI000781CA84|nr:helix-turn-helix transcriptional regulator [Aquimarina longa]